MHSKMATRVARCFFKPKIPIWEHFGGPCNGNFRYLYFMAICNILRPFGIPNWWPFGIVFGHLVYFSNLGMFGPRKIWQPWWQQQKDPHFLFLFCLKMGSRGDSTNEWRENKQKSKTSLCFPALKKYTFTLQFKKSTFTTSDSHDLSKSLKPVDCKMSS
jgi:hypothetical protein